MLSDDVKSAESETENRQARCLHIYISTPDYDFFDDHVNRRSCRQASVYFMLFIYKGDGYNGWL
jgi:hypothetical protein